MTSERCQKQPVTGSVNEASTMNKWTQVSWTDLICKINVQPQASLLYEQMRIYYNSKMQTDIFLYY